MLQSNIQGKGNKIWIVNAHIYTHMKADDAEILILTITGIPNKVMGVTKSETNLSAKQRFNITNCRK